VNEVNSSATLFVLKQWWSPTQPASPLVSRSVGQLTEPNLITVFTDWSVVCFSVLDPTTPEALALPHANKLLEELTALQDQTEEMMKTTTSKPQLRRRFALTHLLLLRFSSCSTSTKSLSP